MHRKNAILEFFKLLIADIFTNLMGYRGRLKYLSALGYARFDNELPDDLADRIALEIDNVISSGDDTGIWRDNCGSDTRILCFERKMPELEKLLGIHEKISDIEEYTGRRITNWYLMANKVVFVEGNAGSGGGLHRDSPFSHQIKYIYYLSDVSPQNGPFAYADASHRLLLWQRKLGVMRHENENEMPALSEITGQRGTLLVADTRGLHRGMPIKSGHRYALTLYTFYSTNAAQKSLENLGLDLIVS